MADGLNGSVVGRTVEMLSVVICRGVVAADVLGLTAEGAVEVLSVSIG